LALGAAFAVIGVAVASGMAIEAERGTCNRNTAGSASVQFQLPTGASLRQHIPTFGIAPELDAITDPVTVVVFEGPHTAVPVFPAFKPRDGSDLVFDNVVCVVAPDGEEHSYFDVDLTTLSLDGLNVDRQAP